MKIENQEFAVKAMKQQQLVYSGGQGTHAKKQNALEFT